MKKPYINEAGEYCICNHIKYDHHAWYYKCYKCKCQEFKLDPLWYLEKCYEQNIH